MQNEIFTMTINELLEMFRDHGVPYCYEAAAAMILQGKWSFAEGVTLPSGKNKFTIYRGECLKWFKEKEKENGLLAIHNLTDGEEAPQDNPIC